MHYQGIRCKETGFQICPQSLQHLLVSALSTARVSKTNFSCLEMPYGQCNHANTSELSWQQCPGFR